MLLSICIPSYNRFEELNEKINSILKAKSKQFEIVVLDNCSPRNIYNYINVRDKRLRIIQRKQAVSGVKNISDSIFCGNAKYSLLLLDKDKLLGDKLDQFINILSQNDVCGGYCQINSISNSYRVVVDNTVKQFGFLSKHPSGNIYNIELLYEFAVLNGHRLDEDTFNFDIYLAYCASKGKMLYYNIPLVESVLDNIEKKDKYSLTFNKKSGNLFYMPQNRINEFMTYVIYLNQLKLNKKEKKQILKYLYKQTSQLVTFDYKYIMSNESICHHYGHDIRKITFIDSIKNQNLLRKKFYSIREVGNFEKAFIDFKVKCFLICKAFYKFLRRQK